MTLHYITFDYVTLPYIALQQCSHTYIYAYNQYHVHDMIYYIDKYYTYVDLFIYVYVNMCIYHISYIHIMLSYVHVTTSR